MCVFNVFFYAFGNRFQSRYFARKHMKPNDYFYFFLQNVSLTLFHLCSFRLWQSTLSTDP